MTLVCSVFGHTAGSVHHRNQGLDFAICHHCGCDLVREDETDWHEVPKGFRVVWREFGRAGEAGNVASRMEPWSAPTRRHPRTGLARRHGHPITGTASLLGMFASFGDLLRASESDSREDVAAPVKTKAIRLPDARH